MQTAPLSMGSPDEVMQRAITDEVEIPTVSMVFSRAAVTNSLMEKLAAKCKIAPKTEEPTEKTTADSLMERLNLIKNWR